MGLSIVGVESLLLVGAVVAVLAQRLRLPYTVGLVLAGLALAVSGVAPAVPLTRETIFSVFLPPLLFEASLLIRWPRLRADLVPILVLATAGLVVSVLITTAGLRVAAGWPWVSCTLLGVLISATDPVSVIATFREAGVKGRLLLLVEAESLFNDGTAAVLFGVALAAATGASLGAGGAAWMLAKTVVGGITCGAAVGFVGLLLAGHTRDHLVEITVTTVVAYGSFLLAEHFHTSGVLACVAAGLVVGNAGELGRLSERGREAVISFWEYAAFAANTLLFLLIGLQLAHQPLRGVWWPASALAVLSIAGRAAAVYGCCGVFVRSSWRVPMKEQHVLVWGGLRGALALALVLGLPPNVPLRSQMQAVVFAVVAFSVIVQGVTIAPLLRRLGIR